MFNTISSDAVKSVAVEPQPEKLPDPTVDMLKTNKLINTLDGPMSFARSSSSTVVNQSGDIETVGTDVPAFGIDGLACFEAVTNECLYSEDFSQWVDYQTGTGGITVTPVFSSPDGNDNASKISCTGINGSQNFVLLTQNISGLTPNADYTLSIWMKGELGGEEVSINLRSTGSQGVLGSTFTLSTSWKRYDVTITNDSGTAKGFQISLYNLADATFYAYGAQATQTSYLAPYIKTEDAPVTRAADNTTIPLSGNLPAAGKPFTIVCDVAVPNNGNQNIIWRMQTAANGTLMLRRNTNTGTPIGFFYSDADGTSRTILAFNVGENKHRFVCLYDGDATTKIYVDGLLSSSNTSNSVKAYDNDVEIYMGSNNSGVLNLNNYIKNFKIYNVALTDDQVAALGGPE